MAGDITLGEASGSVGKQILPFSREGVEVSTFSEIRIFSCYRFLRQVGF